jgi:hypothetical protein
MSGTGPYAQLLGDIRAGARLHYGSDPDQPDLDLALLQGDQLYARGLSQLAELGDLEATLELADVISLVAQAHAAGDRDLALAVWEAGVAAVTYGTTPGLQEAKKLARAGDPAAAGRLRAFVETAADGRPIRGGVS